MDQGTWLGCLLTHEVLWAALAFMVSLSWR
jgi:hypothetical protein